MNRLLIFLSCILLVSCNSKKKEIEFSREIPTQSQVLISEEHTFDPVDIEIMGDYLILGNGKTSPLIEIYNRTTGEPVKSFLNQGEGPEDFLYVANIQAAINDDCLYLSDLFTKKVVQYDWKKVLTDSLPKFEKIYQPTSDSLFYDYIYVNNNFIIAANRNERGRLAYINIKEDKIIYSIDYPDKKNINPELEEFQNATILSASLSMNPAGNKIALSTHNAQMIDLFDLSGEDISPIWNYHAAYPEKILIMPMGDSTAAFCTPETTYGFFYNYSTDKYAYCLYSGKKRSEQGFDHGDEIYVISWDGNETFRVLLDNPVLRIAVDPDNKYVYGINVNKEIVKFELKWDS